MFSNDVFLIFAQPGIYSTCCTILFFKFSFVAARKSANCIITSLFSHCLEEILLNAVVLVFVVPALPHSRSFGNTGTWDRKFCKGTWDCKRIGTLISHSCGEIYYQSVLTLLRGNTVLLNAVVIAFT